MDKKLLSSYKKACSYDDVLNVEKYGLMIFECFKYNDLKEIRQKFFCEDEVEKGFIVACMDGSLNVVSFLMKNDVFPYKCKSLKGFISAAQNEKWNIVEYMIFNFNMRKDGAVEEFLIECSNSKTIEKVNKLFNDRDLKKNLEQLLDNKEKNKNSNKI